MSTVTRRALRVYAALTELRQAKGDVLDSLIPFFEPILQAMDHKIFDPKVFSVAVRKVLKWRFNEDIARQFIPRLRNQGYLKQAEGKHSTFIVTYAPPSEESTQTLPIVELLDTITHEFHAYSQGITELVNYRRSPEELKDILIRFLVSLDVYAEADFVAELARLKPTPDGKSIIDQLEEGGRPLARDDRYVCARFVSHVTQANPHYVPALSRLASIGLLTEVVDDFIKPTQTASRVNLVILLDAPLALDYLGCSGRQIQDDLKAIFDPLRRIGCSFMVFPITCEEISNNLGRMLKLPPRRRYGYTHAAMCRGEVLEDYVKYVARNPAGALEAAGVKLRPMTLTDFPNLRPRFDDARHDDFLSTVTWVEELAPREHDATCMTLLMRLREGMHSSDLFKCRYVFVTRNGLFVDKSREYCLKSRSISANQNGPVIHQRELATVAWLRTGLDAQDSIPRQHLLAVCDRVLRTRKEVTDAVANRLRRLTPESLPQFELLLLDYRSMQTLADETLNDENSVTDDNVLDLLGRIRRSVAAGVADDYERKLDEQKREYEAELSWLRAELEKARAGQSG